MPKLNKKIKKLFKSMNWLANKAVFASICYILYLSTVYFKSGHIIEAFYFIFLCFMVLVLNAERKR